MIYLNNIGANTVTMLLSDHCSSGYPFFTFRLKNKQSRAEIIFAASDISFNPDFYNRFVINITNGQPEPEAGRINALTGEYTLDVIQSKVARNIDLSKCGKVIKNYIVVIVKDKPTVYVNTTSEETFVNTEN